ncbi:MAG: hypothetical protein IK137_03320 [Bacilli bacterium]|nr:hypothetical protein [Bacilli bacterium]
MDDKEYLSAPEIISQMPLALKILLPIVIFKVGERVTARQIQKYRLKKDFEPTNLDKIVMPPELEQKYDGVDNLKIFGQPRSDVILNFAKFLTTTFPDYDLTNFYNNINELKVKEKNLLGLWLATGVGAVGLYLAKSNSILVHSKLNNKETNKVLFHELLHMASTVIKDGVRYTGFCQKRVKNGISIIGKGLNEGYTQLLTERYCKGPDICGPSYKQTLKIMIFLEKAIGKEKVERLYFKADLPGLIKEMGKYVDKHEIARFISGTDFIYTYFSSSIKMRKKEEMIKEKFKDVYTILLKMNIRRLKLDYESNLISEEKMISEIADSVSSMREVTGDARERYTYIKDSEITDILAESLQNNELSIRVNSHRHLTPWL